MFCSVMSLRMNHTHITSTPKLHTLITTSVMGFNLLRKRTSTFFSNILPHHAPPADEYAIASGLGCPPPPPSPPATPTPQVKRKVKYWRKRRQPYTPPVVVSQSIVTDASTGDIILTYKLIESPSYVRNRSPLHCIRRI